MLGSNRPGGIISDHDAQCQSCWGVVPHSFHGLRSLIDDDNVEFIVAQLLAASGVTCRQDNLGMHIVREGGLRKLKYCITCESPSTAFMTPPSRWRYLTTDISQDSEGDAGAGAHSFLRALTSSHSFLLSIPRGGFPFPFLPFPESNPSVSSNSFLTSFAKAA